LIRFSAIESGRDREPGGLDAVSTMVDPIGRPRCAATKPIAQRQIGKAAKRQSEEWHSALQNTVLRLGENLNQPQKNLGDRSRNTGVDVGSLSHPILQPNRFGNSFGRQ